MKKNLRIAFCGTSGSGKTTLVKHIIENYPEIEWINGSAGEVRQKEFRELLEIQYNYFGGGHRSVIEKSATNYSFGQFFQESLLKSRNEAFHNMEIARKSFVTDRSPIDSLTFFALQSSWHLDEDAFVSQEYLESFNELAINTLNQLTHLIYVKPCQPSLIENNGSRVNVRMYQRAVDGAFRNFIDWVYKNYDVVPKLLVIDYWDLQERKSTIDKFLAE
jgi:energy-coupling factor transporter ATP-binding protein EcfA2